MTAAAPAPRSCCVRCEPMRLAPPVTKNRPPSMCITILRHVPAGSLPSLTWEKTARQGAWCSCHAGPNAYCSWRASVEEAYHHDKKTCKYSWVYWFVRDSHYGFIGASDGQS